MATTPDTVVAVWPDCNERVVALPDATWSIVADAPRSSNVRVLSVATSFDVVVDGHALSLSSSGEQVARTAETLSAVGVTATCGPGGEMVGPGLVVDGAVPFVRSHCDGLGFFGAIPVSIARFVAPRMDVLVVDDLTTGESLTRLPLRRARRRLVPAVAPANPILFSSVSGQLCFTSIGTMFCMEGEAAHPGLIFTVLPLGLENIRAGVILENGDALVLDGRGTIVRWTLPTADKWNRW